MDNSLVCVFPIVITHDRLVLSSCKHRHELRWRLHVLQVRTFSDEFPKIFRLIVMSFLIIISLHLLFLKCSVLLLFFFLLSAVLVLQSLQQLPYLRMHRSLVSQPRTWPRTHPRTQRLRSLWPAVGNERRWLVLGVSLIIVYLERSRVYLSLL